MSYTTAELLEFIEQIDEIAVEKHEHDMLDEIAEIVKRDDKIVRCKDCKYFYCCSAVDRRFYCEHQSGLKHVEAVEKDSYCSYGMRKEDKNV